MLSNCRGRGEGEEGARGRSKQGSSKGCADEWSAKVAASSGPEQDVQIENTEETAIALRLLSAASQLVKMLAPG